MSLPVPTLSASNPTRTGAGQEWEHTRLNESPVQQPTDPGEGVQNDPGKAVPGGSLPQLCGREGFPKAVLDLREREASPGKLKMVLATEYMAE